MAAGNAKIGRFQKKSIKKLAPPESSAMNAVHLNYNVPKPLYTGSVQNQLKYTLPVYKRGLRW